MSTSSRTLSYRVGWVNLGRRLLSPRLLMRSLRQLASGCESYPSTALLETADISGQSQMLSGSYHVLLTLHSQRKSSPFCSRAIAVLPFASPPGNAEEAYFTDGLNPQARYCAEA